MLLLEAHFGCRPAVLSPNFLRIEAIPSPKGVRGGYGWEVLLKSKALVVLGIQVGELLRNRDVGVEEDSVPDASQLL